VTTYSTSRRERRREGKKLKEESNQQISYREVLNTDTMDLHPSSTLRAWIREVFTNKILQEVPLENFSGFESSRREKLKENSHS